MDVEILAATAVYLFSTYNYYLNVYKQHRAMKKYGVFRKIKRTKEPESNKKYLMLSKRRKMRENINGYRTKLLAEPSEEFNFVYMSNADFEHLIEKISPIIAKRDTRWREPVSAKVRLSLTLRFLATGETYGSLSALFKLPMSVISRTILEVCAAINNILGDMVKIPSNEDEWLTLSEGFQFPHCLAALDGKHITISPSCYTGTEFVNHVGTFSIVLLTLIDSDNRFIFADIGSEGRMSDDDELKESSLWQKIISNSLNIPSRKALSATNTELPYVFIGDETFPLTNQVMKPFAGELAPGTPQQIFNQHLAQSHGVVENTFGVMSAVFKIFKKPIPLDAEKSSIIIFTCILLHNYLRKSDSSRDIYTPPGSIDIYTHNELVSPGSWRNKSRTNFISIKSSCVADDECAIQTRLDIMNYLFRNTVENNNV